MQVIASWAICCGLLLGGSFGLCCATPVVEKGRNKKKGLDKREKSRWDTWLAAVPAVKLLQMPAAVRSELLDVTEQHLDPRFLQK